MIRGAKRLCIVGLLGLLALSVLLVIALAACESWSPGSIEESQKRAEPIIAALETYFAKHGEFPKTLEDLVPEYIDKLPRPTAGTRRWDYGSGESTFYLSFGCGKHHYPNCTFSWTSKSWMLDQ